MDVKVLDVSDFDINEIDNPTDIGESQDNIFFSYPYYSHNDIDFQFRLTFVDDKVHIDDPPPYISDLHRLSRLDSIQLSNIKSNHPDFNLAKSILKQRTEMKEREPQDQSNKKSTKKVRICLKNESGSQSLKKNTTRKFKHVSQTI